MSSEHQAFISKRSLALWEANLEDRVPHLVGCLLVIFPAYCGAAIVYCEVQRHIIKSM